MKGMYLTQRHGAKYIKNFVSSCLCTFVRIYLLSLVFFQITGCSTLIQKGGEALEGSAFEEKTIALYRSGKKKNPVEVRELRGKNGEGALEITSGLWPGFALRGSIPAGKDGRFELEELRFLSSHVQGWNEFTLDLLGSAAFSGQGELRIDGDVEGVQISSGKIRLKSDRFTGIAALGPLRNRRERITALVEWMHGFLPGADRVFTNQKDFGTFWKPYLFPEIVSNSKRPREYITIDAQWRRADSVKWNLTYTEFLFPEELWEFRNSGALLRDWEEALPWIYMEYSWSGIFSSFNDTIFQRIK